MSVSWQALLLWVSASLVVASLDTQALIAASTASNIVAEGNAIVEAYGRSEYDLWRGSFSAGGAAVEWALSCARLSELMSVTATESPSFGSMARPKRM